MPRTTKRQVSVGAEASAQPAKRASGAQVAAQNKRLRREDSEKLVSIDALKERIKRMAPEGDNAEEDAIRLTKLAEWEARVSVDFSLLQLWPVHPRTFPKLNAFLNQDHNNKPNGVTSMRFRWTLGLSATVYGRLEDVRWMMFGPDLTWRGNPSLAKTVDWYQRKHLHLSARELAVNTGLRTHDDVWIHNDRHLPGPSTPRHPSMRNSGGVYATCLLAAFQLRWQDLRAGWERETQPYEILTSQWTSLLPKVYGSCWALRQARLGSGLETSLTYEQKRTYVATFAEVVLALIKFVWREALDSAGISKDANVARTWTALHQGCSQDHLYLDKLWHCLKSWAYDPHAASSEQCALPRSLAHPQADDPLTMIYDDFMPEMQQAQRQDQLRDHLHRCEPGNRLGRDAGAVEASPPVARSSSITSTGQSDVRTRRTVFRPRCRQQS
ncbi:unnamed protein product [Jaminaea pallidilutea]